MAETGTGELPPGYHIGKSLDAPSRWIVSYRGNPFFFVEKINALGEERMKTFKTKGQARERLETHLKEIAQLEKE